MNKLLVPLFAIALPVVGDAATAPAAPVQQQAVQQQPQWVSAQQQPQLQAGGFPAAPGTQPATPQQPYPTTNYGPTAYATNATTVPYSQNVVNQQGAVAVAQNNQNQPLPPLPPLTPPSKMEQASKIVAPLKPSEIRALRDQFEDVRRANAYQPLKAVPKISSLSVDLSPGSALPILRVLPGEMSTIVFVDATGAPWPLAAAPRVSDSTLFDVEWLEGTPSVVVSAMTTFQDGIITVFLQGLATPIVVKLATIVWTCVFLVVVRMRNSLLPALQKLDCITILCKQSLTAFHRKTLNRFLSRDHQNMCRHGKLAIHCSYALR